MKNAMKYIRGSMMTKRLTSTGVDTVGSSL